jgi:hypothetical protein
VLRFEGSEVFFLKSTSVTRPACGGPARNSWEASFSRTTLERTKKPKLLGF